MMKFKYILFISALLFGTFKINAQDERRFIRSGNSHFTDSAYLESEIEYRKALDKTGNSFEGQFNLGDALYKQEKFNDALDQFQILAGTETDPQRLSQVYHNIGNSYFAMQKFQESVEAYKNALRNNPDDNGSRYNLIAAQKMLQQQQQDQQNQDQNKDQDQQEQQNKDQQQQQQDQQQDQNKDQQQQQQDQQEQDQQKNQQNQQQRPEEQMSKEDAQRLLNAIQQDENELQKKLRKAKAAQQTKTEKNW
ncbi:tetratricopeptide repeat protein [Carboxylicivirga sp. RSCT41]|uniref:tetratricopeptide repeat protein n=1 Tax=Carboxylicivirga agarovorans TaxID=3417570 RepID=UPI003D34320B